MQTVCTSAWLSRNPGNNLIEAAEYLDNAVTFYKVAGWCEEPANTIVESTRTLASVLSSVCMFHVLSSHMKFFLTIMCLARRS